jgi:hypothetical protein
MFEIRHQFRLLAEEMDVSSLSCEADFLSPCSNRNLESISYHSNTNGPWTKEIYAYNDRSFYAIRMKRIALGIFDVKQFEFESLMVVFNMKKEQNIELVYCKGRFIYTKHSIFGYICSSETFNSSNLKSVLTFYSSTFFKSSVRQLIDHEVSTLVNGAHPHLRMDNSIGK